MDNKEKYKKIRMEDVYKAIVENGFYTTPTEKHYDENFIGPELIVVTDDPEFKVKHPELSEIRNLVNIFASKEDFLWDALQVSSARSGYCAKSDPRFVEELNRKKPKTIEKIKELWYRGNMNEQYRHYSNTRYHALNLHSYFQHGHYEIRCCNASLHAGEVRAQIVLALAISNAAMTKK